MQYGPDRPAFGVGATSTTVHPLILVATALTVLLVLFLPRRRVVYPFLLLIFLGSIGQQFYIAGIHWFVLRIVILAGLVRVAFATDKTPQGRFGSGWNSVDTVYVLWAIFRAVTSILQAGGVGGAIIYQTGFLLDALGGYLVLRFLIRDEEDIVRVIKVFAFIFLTIGVSMLNEKLRSQNIFGYVVGVPIVPDIREGSVRAQGASAHPILAGVLGVTSVPLFWWLWQSGKSKIMAVLGTIGSTLMMLASSSSTPLLAYLGAIAAVCFWPMRKSMRAFRWGVVSVMVALHLVMKAPVWFLIARVDLVAGNSGYHRAMLIDQCIRHFWDWWLIGTSTGSWGWDMWDLSNQFVAEADTGGLVTVICFILVISRGFSRVGRARKIIEGDTKQEWFMWLIGATLFAHCVSFFGVSYFDHTKIAWSAFLSILIVATAPILQQETAVKEETGRLFRGAKLAVASPAVESSSRSRLPRLENDEPSKIAPRR